MNSRSIRVDSSWVIAERTRMIIGLCWPARSHSRRNSRSNRSPSPSGPGAITGASSSDGSIGTPIAARKSPALSVK